MLNDVGKGKVLFSREMDGAIFVSVTFTQCVGATTHIMLDTMQNVSWNLELQGNTNTLELILLHILVSENGHIL